MSVSVHDGGRRGADRRGGADTVPLTAYEAVLTYVGVKTSEFGAALQTDVASGREFRLSLATLLPCPA